MNREDILKRIITDRRMAHEILFQHRHPDTTPEFHGEMIDAWHDPTIKNLSIMAFRNAAKSTVGCEEATIILAALGIFKNGLIVGEKYERAVERLNSIKHELTTNEMLYEIFGDLKGPIWTEGKIELSNGTVIQAIGRGQSVRGIKHHDKRPDYLVGDDIEDMESVKTEEAKRATLAWFISVLLPACEKHATKRIVGTPLETDSLMETLGKDKDWKSLKYPIEYIDIYNQRRPTWESKFPLEEIDKIKSTFTRMGMLLEYGREYMCEARSGVTRSFTQDMMKVVPEVRKWHGVFAMYDPARTVNTKTSAHTGVAIWSWVGNRLVIWRASGHFYRPDEMIADMLKVAEEYNPVLIGVEEDGLNEYVMQPIRHETSKRNLVLPIRAMKAPKGKLDFISSLQPFFKSGEATMVNPCPDLTQQLLNFPVGRIDVPNALAYALKLRPGLPVYEDFNESHIIAADLFKWPKVKYIVACNYFQGAVTAIMYCRTKDQVIVTADFVAEGDPQQRAENLIEWANFEAGSQKNLQYIVHPDHFERYSASGFVGALKKFGISPRQGGDPTKGRGWIISKLQRKINNHPAFQILDTAKWALNGFSAGYAFEFSKAGKGLSDRAPEGIYRTAMEGFESAASLSSANVDAADEDDANYATDSNGKRYLSSMPARK